MANSPLRRRYLMIVFLILFALSRTYIWIFRPLTFSEIIYSYMPYAHLWASGVMPYREQWYEYPPATIPLFYIPHFIDKNTHPPYSKAFPINYLQAYRGELLVVDTMLFAVIWWTLIRQKVRARVLYTALLYYIIITAKANHFIYDTMDLTFTATMTLGVAAPILLIQQLRTFGQWFGFFLATALKYVNAPLAPIYVALDAKHWKASLLGFGAAALVVWGVPLALFRSSLLVSLVYQNIRGIQIDSAPAVILRTLDRFTHSEHVIEVYKNYEFAGPMTDVAKGIVKWSFPAAIAVFLLGSLWIIWQLRRTKNSSENTLRIHFTLGYVLVFMLTAKVLSTPFLLWHIPLLAIYPFKDWKTQLQFLIPSLLLIFTSMIRVSNLEFGFMTLPLLVAWIRTICFAIMLALWVRETKQFFNRKKIES